jgi:hypothetical protein
LERKNIMATIVNVIIRKASSRGYWYADKVGEIFPATKQDEKQWLTTAIDHPVIVSGLIDVADCEIVEDRTAVECIGEAIRTGKDQVTNWADFGGTYGMAFYRIHFRYDAALPNQYEQQHEWSDIDGKRTRDNAIVVSANERRWYLSMAKAATILANA